MSNSYVLERIKEMKMAPRKVIAPNEWVFNRRNENLVEILYGYTELSVGGSLPEWPASMRGMPNSVLRSALFGVIRRGKREFKIGQEIASIGGVHVTHMGPQLDQSDLDVWAQCIQLARHYPLGLPVEFTTHSFLKDIGRDTGKSQYDWLKCSMHRLMTSLVEIKDGKDGKVFAGRLIHHLCRDEKTGNQSFCIHPRMAYLFGPKSFSWIDWDHRSALKKNKLAQWLHGFYSSHARPFPYKVATLHHLCGSQAKNVSDFRKDLRRAFKLLELIAGWEVIMERTGTVRVNRRPSKSQERFLAKKPVSKLKITAQNP